MLGGDRHNGTRAERMNGRERWRKIGSGQTGTIRIRASAVYNYAFFFELPLTIIMGTWLDIFGLAFRCLCLNSILD
jgi:hypothetical protein